MTVGKLPNLNLGFLPVRKPKGRPGKTNGVDAQGLAMMACQQRLEGWKPISEAMYKLRQVTRQHTQLQEFKTQLNNQLIALEAGMYQASEKKTVGTATSPT